MHEVTIFIVGMLTGTMLTIIGALLMGMLVNKRVDKHVNDSQALRKSAREHEQRGTE